MQRHSTRTPRGLHGLILDAIAEPPPTWPGERWFHDDLDYLDRQQLLAERDRLRLRVLLTPRRERDDWPARWVAARLERVEELLRAHHTAAAWSRVQRRP